MDSKCRGCFKDLCEQDDERISVHRPYKSQYCLATVIFESISLKAEKNDGGPEYVCFNCAEKLVVISDFRAMYIETNKRIRAMLKSPTDTAMQACVTGESKLPYYDDDPNLSLSDADDILTEALSNVFGWDLFPVASDAVAQGAAGAMASNMNKNFYNMDMLSPDITTNQPLTVNPMVEQGPGILSDITEIIAQENLHQSAEIGTTVNLHADSWLPQDIIDSSDDTLTSFMSSAHLSPMSSEPQSPTSSQPQYTSSYLTDSLNMSSLESPQPLQSPTSTQLLGDQTFVRDKKPKYLCNQCENAFSSMDALTRHIPLHNQKQTQCPHCPKAFSHSSNLRRHLVRHNQSSRFTCDFCDEAFSDSEGLIDHLKMHTTNSSATDRVITTYVLECEVCGFRTLSYAAFINHMRNNHPEADVKKVFKCRICGEGFCTKQGMFRHIDNIHENNRLNLRNQKKNFLCNECGKSFFSNVQLIVHERTHNGDRPFKCEHCPKSFAQITGLKMHTYTHTGERPFVCRVCDKTFTQPGHLKEHLLLHQNLKPHICSICNHSFRVKGNLTAHMLTHIGGQKTKNSCHVCGKHFPSRNRFLAHKIDCKPKKDKEN